MRRDRIIRSHMRTRFVITLKTGDAFEGLLIDADSRMLVLADAWLISESDRVSVDGQLYIERSDVAFMQLPAVAAGVIAQ